MTMMNAVAAAPTGFYADGAARREGSWSLQLRRTAVRWRSYRALLAELRALPDLQLEDLGLERVTLKAFCHKAIYTE